MALGLPDSPHKLVFREIVRILRADPTLSGALRGLIAWEGRPSDARPLSLSQAPIIRLTPLGGPDAWLYPEAFKNTLFIKAEVLVAGFDVGDMLDLWWAVKRALYPADFAAKNDIVNRLRAAGATTGTAVFAVQAADTEPEQMMQAAVGQINIDVREQLNT